MRAPLRIRLILGLWAGLAAMGCSGADSSAKRQLDDMRREIDSIQADNSRLNDRVTSLELAGTGSSPQKKATPRDQRPELEVVRLSPEGSPRGADPPEPRDADDGPPTVIRAEGNMMPSVRRGSTKADNDAAAQSRAQRDYDDALELVDRKRYDEALEALSTFLVRYPGHANADNAAYWRGECYYAKGDYVRAADQFEGLIARFPNGNKVPDAMLKLGLCQRRMGERDKATKTFALLQKNHPSSEAARKIPRE